MARKSSATPGQFALAFSTISILPLASATGLVLRGRARSLGDTGDLVNRADVAHHEIREQVVFGRSEHRSRHVSRHCRPQRARPQAYVLARFISGQFPNPSYFAKSKTQQQQKEKNTWNPCLSSQLAVSVV